MELLWKKKKKASQCLNSYYTTFALFCLVRVHWQGISFIFYPYIIWYPNKVLPNKESNQTHQKIYYKWS